MPDNEQPNSDQPETPEIVPSVDELPITVSEYVEMATPKRDLFLKVQGNVTEGGND